jgi:very-short-patch-repair endonuclease
VLPEVFCISGSPPSFQQEVMSATMWCGDGSAASGWTAAALRGLDGFPPTRIEISTINERRPRPGLIVHRVDRNLLRDIVNIAAIPATSPRRTLLELAAHHPNKLDGALNQCLLRRLVDDREMWLFLEESWTFGRRGIARLRRAVMERTDGPGSRSALEVAMKRLLISRGLPEPKREFRVKLPNGVAIHNDFAYPAALLAIETDGYAWHSSPKAFERDRERDALLQSIGWSVLRFTWAQIKWRPDYVASTIRAHLARVSSELRIAQLS